MKRASVLKLLLLAALPAMALGCESNTTGPSPAAEPPGSAAEALLAFPNPLGTPITCTRQPYAKVVKVLGPQGGQLKVGGHEFTLPRGALFAPVQITMEAVSDTVRSVRFSPDGLVFHPLYQPTLKLGYKGCKVPKGVKQKVAWVTERLLVLQVLATREDSLAATANANLQHFSRYAVAW